MQVSITTRDGEPADTIGNVDEVSFVNADSYGPGERFGITDNFTGTKVIINVNGISHVEIQED